MDYVPWHMRIKKCENPECQTEFLSCATSDDRVAMNLIRHVCLEHKKVFCGKCWKKHYDEVEHHTLKLAIDK